jgi:hypothetical protein
MFHAGRFESRGGNQISPRAIWAMFAMFEGEMVPEEGPNISTNILL